MIIMGVGSSGHHERRETKGYNTLIAWLGIFGHAKVASLQNVLLLRTCSLPLPSPTTSGVVPSPSVVNANEHIIVAQQIAMKLVRKAAIRHTPGTTITSSECTSRFTSINRSILPIHTEDEQPPTISDVSRWFTREAGEQAY